MIDNTAQRTVNLPPPRLAVVEDDSELRDSVLVPLLTRSGFEVAGLGSALALYRAMTARPYDLVLLDVSLPDEDGFSIASHLRSLSPSMGIVMLTGYASSQDRVQGLRAGADAYFSKPASMEVLAATLLNLARRVRPGAEPPASDSGWRLERSGWRLVSPGGVAIAMSLAERQIMSVLATAAGTPVRRESLIATLVESIHDFDPHRLEMLVYRLRKKCLTASGEALSLQAVRGIGYVLNW